MQAILFTRAPPGRKGGGGSREERDVFGRGQSEHRLSGKSRDELAGAVGRGLGHFPARRLDQATRERDTDRFFTVVVPSRDAT